MNIMALILAGGAGRRMAGYDKGLQLWHGVPLIDHVIQIIQPQVQHIVISANRHLADYAQRQKPVLADEAMWQRQGPLAALASLTQHPNLWQNSDYLLVVPCDTPKLPNDLVQHLLQAMKQQATAQLCYAVTKQQEHFSVCLLKTSILPTVIPYLQRGKRSIQGWLKQHTHTTSLFVHEAAFVNMNTLAALAS